MKKIAICNQKGGVAKTTTAINLSAYLALSGKKTLLIDMDPQANASSGVGVDKHAVEKSSYDVLHEHVSIDETIKKTSIENLYILPSEIALTGAEVELVSAMGREQRLKRAVNDMKERFDYIIVDCPPSLGLLTLNALTMVDSIVIPVQCEYYALEGVTRLIKTFNLIRDNLNNSLEIEGVLLTMADFRTHLTKEVISEVKTHFKEKAYDTVIPRAIKLTEAPGFGQPIVTYDKTSLGALKYKELTEEFLGKQKETKKEESPREETEEKTQEIDAEKKQSQQKEKKQEKDGKSGGQYSQVHTDNELIETEE